MPKKRWKKVEAVLCKAIPHSVGQSHKQSLQSRIHYGYQFSLRKRIQLLLKRLPKSLAARLAGNPSQFANQVTDTRNYLTHYDPDDAEKCYGNQQLWLATERLKLLLIALTLKDLGIPGMEVLDLMEQHWPTRQLLDRPL